MRLTLHTPDPDGQSGWHAVDVDADEGAPLGALRPYLARFTGHAGWAGPQRLAVGPQAVDDAHPCGSPPLVEGAVLSLGRGPRPADEAALRTTHLAVLSGPDCGRLLAVADGIVVGRRGSDDRPGATADTGAGDPARHALADPLLSARHIELCPHRRGARARDLGSANGTTLRRVRAWPRVRPASRSRQVRGRWVLLRPGDRIGAGATELELRGPDGSRASRPAAGRADDASAPSSGPVSATAWTWAAPTIGSVALAATTGHRVLLLTALLGPLLAVGHALAGRRRRQAAPARADDAAGGQGAGSMTGQGDHVDNPADLLTATVRAGHAPLAPRFGAEACRAEPVVALVGPREWTLGAARALVLGAVGTHGRARLDVRADPEHIADWSWTRWLTGASLHGEAAPEASPATLVLDGPGCIAAAARDVPSASEGDRLLLLVPTASAAPAWCRALLHVGLDGARLDTPLGEWSTPLRAVSHGWAEQQARRVAGLRSAAGASRAARPGAAGRERPLPRDMALGSLPGVPGPGAEHIRRGWAAPRRAGLGAVIGVNGSGPVRVDLLRDGPHALVAGTTGAGKSALLRTLVLSLALAHPPEQLVIALVDYKGGASFGPCADLPHVVGQVTDLDGHLALRALTGLRAELRRREHVLAEAACADLAELWARHVPGSGPPPPPRLLVVIDEFRALADEAPDFVPGLLRLAAQGRSLGMHLVLATQRPAGAVTPDLRANITLRIALRVTDTAESLDVIEAPDAAHLPVNRPGRAVLRRGNAPVEHFQVAQARGPGAMEPVRLAAPWSAPIFSPATWPGRTPSATAWSPPQERKAPEQGPGTPAIGPAPLAEERPRPPTPSDPAAADERAYVAAILAAAHGHAAPTAPWLPELPPTVLLRDLPPDDDPCPPEDDHCPPEDDPGAIPLALADVPERQCREVVRWKPAHGHLLVIGEPGSGRTEALRTAAAGALGLGWQVHAVGFATPPVPLACLGTVVGADDPRRLARLLTLLAERPRTADGAESDPAGPRQLVLVDGWEPVHDALDGIGRGGAGRLLTDLLRDGLARGVTVAAASGAVARMAALGGHFPDRLVLGMDAVDQVLAGAPARLTGRPRHRGRAVHLRGSEARECQIALVEGTPAARRPRGGRALRLLTIPIEVTLADLDVPRADAREDHIPVGLGGDDATVVCLDVARGVLVTGPAGSGRTTALAVLAHGLLDRGRAVAVVGSDAALLRVPGVRWASEPAGLADLLDELAAERVGGMPEVDLLVDDLDVIEQMHPAQAERLARESAAPQGGLRVLASARTARAATAYREPIARLRSARAGLVLDPLEPGSGDVFGLDLTTVADPSRAHAAGRGAVVRGRTLTPVQVARSAPG